MRDEIIVFKSGTSEHSAKGMASLGGFWSMPNYTQSYKLAARELFNVAEATGRLDELALPCIYLQRHTLELALKDLLFAVDSNERDAARLQEAHRQEVTAKPFTPEDRKVYSTKHDLALLLDTLERNLERSGRQAVPGSWKRVANEFALIEMENPERFRYDRVRERSGASQELSTSFPEKCTMPLRDLLDALEQMLREAVSIDVSNYEECSWLQDLCAEGQQLGQELYSLGL